MKNKVIIAVTQNVNEDGTTDILPAYLDALINVGAEVKLVPYTNSRKELYDIIEICDGVCFTGGVDVDPERYGEEKTTACGPTCEKRDTFDFMVFGLAIEQSKPILGICRGEQLINVALGGTLYQDLQAELGTEISHVQSEPKFEHSHEINIEQGSPLYALLGKEKIRANSFHHQAIKTFGKGLKVMASADDGVIEAVYLQSYPYLRAYQWHPERICQNDENQQKIFEDFITFCKEN